jgi:SEC-C motif-containing protein
MRKDKRRTIFPETECPCKSSKLFGACCSSILVDHSLAATPEMLMRSRFTAFVIEDSAFLLRSWDNSTRPQSIHFENNIVWLRLIIEDAPQPLPGDSAGTVTFRAYFIQNDKFVEMKEQSTFTRKRGLWFYLNGELTLQEKPISFKDKCPCGSGKKYKRCCRT